MYIYNIHVYIFFEFNETNGISFLSPTGVFRRKKQKKIQNDNDSKTRQRFHDNYNNKTTPFGGGG